MKKSKFRIYSVLALALTTSAVVAQPANQFFLESLPQSGDINPAKTRQSSFHMNFPAFFMAGHTSMNGSLPFSFSDIATTDGVTTTVSMAGLLEGIKDNNYINMGFQKNFLNYGWIKGKNYWNFSIGTTFNVDFNYNSNFMELFVKGPGDEQFVTGNPVSLDGTAWDVSVYQDYGLGYSRDVNQKLRLGGKFRLLSGGMNFKGSLDGVSLTTATDLTSLTIASAISAQSSTPLSYVDGIDPVTGDSTSTLDNAATQSNLTSALTSFANAGVALDLGASYKINDNISAFVSVRDFGLISWAEGNKYENKADASFTFEGFTVAQLQDSTFTSELGDSISNILKLEKTAESYTTYLPTRFFVGGEYKLNNQFSANALYSGRYANSKLNSTIVAGFGWMPSKVFEARVSYTIKNGTYDNVGLATVLTMGAWQLYFITDNILGLTAIDYAKNINAAFGSNLSFGRAKYFDERKAGANGVNKTGDEKSKSDSSSTSTPDMTPTITPENSVKENVDAIEKAEQEKKASDVKAGDAKSEAKDDVKDSRDKADNKVDDARDDANDVEKDARKDAKDAQNDADKSEDKAQDKAKDDADKAENRAVKAIDAAEEKIDEADTKVKAAKAEAKAANKEAAAAKKAAVVKAIAPVATPAASPNSAAVSDSTSTSAVPAVSIDSLLIKPSTVPVKEVAPAAGTSSATPVKVDATPKDINSNKGVEALDKVIEVIEVGSENKENDVPSDIK